MEYISLGSTCAVAFQKQRLGLKHETYPFDWVRVDSFDMINDILYNRFANFTTNLVKVTESNKFPVFVDDFSTNNSTSIIMKNCYGIKFYHDFTNDIDINQVTIKYQRRIDRLLQLIQSSKPICFVRDELKPHKLSNAAIDRFIKLINTINPNCQFKLILILHKPVNITITNKDVKVLIDNNDFGHWTRPNVLWQLIFS